MQNNSEKGFRFYEDVSEPLYVYKYPSTHHLVAYRLEDFIEKLKWIPIKSIEFHKTRGDFSRWIREIFQDDDLADFVENISVTGEKLRMQLLSKVSRRINEPIEDKNDHIQESSIPLT